VKHHASLILIALAAALAGVAQVTSGASATREISELPIGEIAAAYKSYRKMTAQEVYVNPELAMLCVGASQSQVEAARKTKGPHAHAAIWVYMNEIAARDFDRRGGTYSLGAVVIKQKTLLGYRAGKSDAWTRATENGVGGMVKRAKGFDSAHGDWEYFYFEDPSKIESGRISSCVKCHDGAKGTDYVVGTWAKSGAKKG
jgi:hypothetical protein